MKAIIEDEEHRVVYIEYRRGIPHGVVSQLYVPDAVDGPYWRNIYWDCFANNGDKDDLYLYKSGSGGDIDAPHFADGFVGEIWIEKGIELNGTPINCKVLDKPKRIRTIYRGSSINPFRVAEITHSCEFCEVCGEESIDICWEHVYEDEDDNYELKYRHDNSPYN